MAGSPSYNYASLPYKGRVESGVVHKCEFKVKIPNQVDIEFIAKFLYKDYKVSQSSGKIYDCKVFKEAKGETLTYYEYKNGGKGIQFTSHRISRLRVFMDFALKNNWEFTYSYIEVYVRILKVSEERVKQSIEALRKSMGVGYTSNVITEKFRDINILYRVESFEYRGVKVSVKLYYDKKLREEPKIEVSVRKDGFENIDNLLSIGAGILRSIIDISKPLVIFNDYDQAQDKILLASPDPFIKTRIRGTLPRIKGEALLGKQLKDKHKIVRDLLVYKKLKPSEIAKVLGYSRRYITRIITDLINSGEITRVGRGKYSLEKNQPPSHPLRSQIIINGEYPAKEILIYYQEFDKHKIIEKYTKEGWISHEDNRTGISPLVFYRQTNGEYEYLVVRSVVFKPVFQYSQQYSTL